MRQKHLLGSQELKAFAGSLVQLVGDLVKFLLGEATDIRVTW
jgi:hypothetical protein